MLSAPLSTDHHQFFTTVTIVIYHYNHDSIDPYWTSTIRFAPNHLTTIVVVPWVRHIDTRRQLQGALAMLKSCLPSQLKHKELI